MNRKLLMILTTGLLVAASGCKKDDNTPEPPTPGGNAVVGYLYTSTNGQATNQVVRFARHADGTLSDEMAYLTNSLGGANIGAGGDAHGDYDAQGGLKLIGNYLLVVNGGGGNVSVFSVDHANGDLAFMSNVSSGGMRPVSIASTPISGQPDMYWVVVGNQWDNPNVQKDLPNVQRFPNDAFFMGDLSQPDASDADRNIELFQFNGATGTLTPQSQLANYPRRNGGPTCVTFSDDGTKLAVSTWGIAHFGTVAPSTTEQRPSRVYVYDFSGGAVSNGRYFEEVGIAGTIGISWAPDNNNTLFASNFNVTVPLTDNSVTVLSDGGNTVTKTANYATGSATDLDEACWTVISPNNDRLYVASFTGNVISPFSLSGSTITGALPVEPRGGNAPAGDSKEMYVTNDNKYLYNTGALQSFSVNLFNVTAGGVDYRSQTTLQTTMGAVGQLGAYNFIGLDGYDL
ncbi:MAG: hypothetical protein ACOH13_06440 [Flavobacteriales bacterium]